MAEIIENVHGEMKQHEIPSMAKTNAALTTRNYWYIIRRIVGIGRSW